MGACSRSTRSRLRGGGAGGHRAPASGPGAAWGGAEGLRRLTEEGAGPFDLVFIDADKQGTPEYFELSLQLVRPGGLILVDNVVRDGALADPDTDDPRALGMRRFHELAAKQPRVEATTIQTVGSKGYDGFTMMLVDAA
jgi:predicted O-methyltransferase YrrM